MAAAAQSSSELEKLDPWSNCCSSESVTETVTGSSKFTVRGYSLLKGMGRGKYVSSDVFSVGGYDWEIRFYPDEEPSGHPSVIVHIVMTSYGGANFRASMELMLLDQSGKGRHFHRQQISEPPTWSYAGQMWGINVHKAHLERSKCLKDDGLVVRASVGVITTRRLEERDRDGSIIVVPGSNLGQGMKELLESELGCDVVFRVGDETFKAHKSILGTRSPFFRAQFFGPVGNPNSLNEIVVDDIHPSVFKAMLVFIYTDKLPDVQDIMSSSSSSSSMSAEATNIIQHLLVAADLYNLDRLKVLCESKLCEELSASSVATTLELAEQHYCAQLKVACLKFATHPANVREMMQSESFKHLKESCLRELLMKALAPSSTGDNEGVDESSNPNTRRVRRRTG